MEDPLFALYVRPGVQAACLTLQDRDGADVNLLLFAAWLGGARGAALTPAQAAEVAALCGPWREGVIRPLRAARRALPRDHALRPRFLSLEIEAEREQIATIRAWADGRFAEGLPGAAQALTNLRAVLGIETQEARVIAHQAALPHAGS